MQFELACLSLSLTRCAVVCVCARRRPHFPDDMVIKRLSPGALKSAFRQNVRKGLGGCKTNDALVCRSGALQDTST